MKFTQIKHLVFESLTYILFLPLVTSVIFHLLLSKKYNLSPILTVVVFFVSVLLGYSLTKLGNAGVKAFIDLVSKKTKTDIYEFVDKQIYYSNPQKGNFKPRGFYLFLMKKDGRIYSFLSEDFTLNFKKKSIYSIKSGYLSNVIIKAKQSRNSLKRFI